MLKWCKKNKIYKKVPDGQMYLCVCPRQQLAISHKWSFMEDVKIKLFG